MFHSRQFFRSQFYCSNVHAISSFPHPLHFCVGLDLLRRWEPVNCSPCVSLNEPNRPLNPVKVDIVDCVNFASRDRGGDDLDNTHLCYLHESQATQTMRLFLIRHAETVHNVAQAWYEPSTQDYIHHTHMQQGRHHGLSSDKPRHTTDRISREAFRVQINSFRSSLCVGSKPSQPHSYRHLPSSATRS